MSIDRNIYHFIIKYGIGIKNSNGYATTLAHPLFTKVKGNIFVIDFNTGNIYHIFDTKEDFIERITARKNDKKIVVYYNSNIKFTELELETCSNPNTIMIDEKRKNTIAFHEMRSLSPPASFIGDFIPGYVETFSHPMFYKIPVNIIVIGFEDGLIYNLFDTKEDFLRFISDRKSRMKLNVYHNNIVFTKSEAELLWNANIWLSDQKIKDRIGSSWRDTMKLVYM